ncbi:MAG: fructosamine kinase family protein [Bacteroidota bacterium]
MFTDDSGFFESALFQSLGRSVTVRSSRFVSGGCINNTLKLETDEGPFFLKWNNDSDNDMFEKEAMGLKLLRDQKVLNLPEVLGTGSADGKNYLLLSYIQKSPPSGNFWKSFGQSLAALHRVSAPKYGLSHNNYIGRLPQNNEEMQNWIDFFIEKRLEVQLGLAIYNGFVDQEFAKRFRMIYAQLPGLIPSESAALLHGDLWSGNFMSGTQGLPFVYDPAVYFGHREIELAFTRLFGGFERLFYESYHESFPLEPGFEERLDIYNLYPLLVHVNLFGTSYLSGINQTLRRFL